MFIIYGDHNPERYIARPFGNWAIIGFCVLLLGLTSLFPGLLNLMAFHPADAVGPSIGAALAVPLRMVTSIFVHAGFWHLFFNMLMLWVVGKSIEDSVGHARYPAFFVLCGLGSALVHAVADGRPVLGASGAVAGCMAAYMLLFPNAVIKMIGPRLTGIADSLGLYRVPALLVFAGYFAMDALLIKLRGEEGVAHWAHLGGALTGALLILVMRRPEVPLFHMRDIRDDHWEPEVHFADFLMGWDEYATPVKWVMAAIFTGLLLYALWLMLFPLF